MSDLNAPEEPDIAGIERHASWTEHFFDLVAVAGVGDSAYSYPALTADGALVVGSRNGRLVAIG